MVDSKDRWPVSAHYSQSAGGVPLAALSSACTEAVRRRAATSCDGALHCFRIARSSPGLGTFVLSIQDLGETLGWQSVPHDSCAVLPSETKSGREERAMKLLDANNLPAPQLEDERTSLSKEALKRAFLDNL